MSGLIMVLGVGKLSFSIRTPLLKKKVLILVYTDYPQRTMFTCMYSILLYILIPPLRKQARMRISTNSARSPADLTRKGRYAILPTKKESRA